MKFIMLTDKDKRKVAIEISTIKQVGQGTNSDKILYTRVHCNDGGGDDGSYFDVVESVEDVVSLVETGRLPELVG